MHGLLCYLDPDPRARTTRLPAPGAEGNNYWGNAENVPKQPLRQETKEPLQMLTSRDIKSPFQSSSLRSWKVNLDLLTIKGFSLKFNGCFVLADASKLGWEWGHMFYEASTPTFILKLLPT